MDQFSKVNFNIERMKEVFGNMPIDHLPASQELAKNKKLTKDILIVAVSAMVVGGIFGYYMRKRMVESGLNLAKPMKDQENSKEIKPISKVETPKSNQNFKTHIKKQNSNEGNINFTLEEYLAMDDNPTSDSKQL